MRHTRKKISREKVELVCPDCDHDYYDFPENKPPDRCPACMRAISILGHDDWPFLEGWLQRRMKRVQQAAVEEALRRMRESDVTDPKLDERNFPKPNWDLD